MDILKIKQQLIEFTTQSVKKFLRNNPDLEFYAFAYDCNAEYAEINLCFNTIKAFEETLSHYRNGKSAEKYKLAQAIKDLKYNTGDWEYQCFESVNILSEEVLNEIFNDLPDDDYKSWNKFTESLMELFCECLLEFRISETFERIPKTIDFVLLCIDHDENLEAAEERLRRIEKKRIKR